MKETGAVLTKTRGHAVLPSADGKSGSLRLRISLVDRKILAGRRCPHLPNMWKILLVLPAKCDLNA
jgi:hypothetical protein